jgi:hypothetical protein
LGFSFHKREDFKMPIEKDVQERQSWWCPKWYWPFAVCSGIRTAHKWCYNFAWVRETGYGLISRLEGCENGKLFTWTKFSLNIFGSNTYPSGELCFDSPCSSAGRCDPSNTGLQNSPLSPSKPFVSNLDYDVRELRSNVVETGTFEFTAESGGICQQGLWPWKKTLHEEVITVSVAARFVDIQWYIEGIPIVNNSGMISISAFCRWPFPLPKGRSENRVLQVKYEIITEANKSTLKVFNDPGDGSYSLYFGMSALEDGKEYTSSYTSLSFLGETCDFDPKQIKEKDECLREFSDLSKDKAKSREPKLGEPVVAISEEIWRFVREDRSEAVDSLLEIITNSFHDDPETVTRATNQLEQEIGFAGISRLITIGSAEKGQKVVLQR